MTALTAAAAVLHITVHETPGPSGLFYPSWIIIHVVHTKETGIGIYHLAVGKIRIEMRREEIVDLCILRFRWTSRRPVLIIDYFFGDLLVEMQTKRPSSVLSTAEGSELLVIASVLAAHARDLLVAGAHHT